MTKYLVSLIMLFGFFACKNKNKSSGEKGDNRVEATGFFSAYSKLKLPFTVTDTTMKEVADTNTISYSNFTQIIPDSIFNNPFGKDRKFTIHPIGKIEVKGKETYFATLVEGKSASAIYLSVYDKNKFTANLPLVVTREDDKVTTASIDEKLSIIINKEWTIKNELFYNRIIYAYNNVGVFTTVLTETNESRKTGIAVNNPLDTLPKKYKYSGDYIKGTKSYLSIRDGKKPNEYLFFVHFENEDDQEACAGELKGMFRLIAEKTGVYKGSGDPCKLNFTFSSNEATVKETGGCGNYRGIKCFFNHTYLKKKETKTRPSGKKK